MYKQHTNPADHWSWRKPVNHSQAARGGDLIWVSGQMDLDSTGHVRNDGDLSAQIAAAFERLSRVLDNAGSGVDELVKLHMIYVTNGSVDETGVLAEVARLLPAETRPAVTALPVAYMAYPGVLCAIDAIAMPGELERTTITADGLSPLPHGFAHGVRAGKMIYISAQTALSSEGGIAGQTRTVMEQVGHALAGFGATFADVVKMNRWYVGTGTEEDFEPSALACAASFTEPGPAATGIPLPRLARAEDLVKIEVIAMLNEDGSRLPRRHAWPDSLWDWTIDIPYWHGLKCHDMIFLGGQVSLDTKGHAVNPFDMRAQTAQAMVHISSILRELGASYDDICKLTTLYANRQGADELHENLDIRSSFFTSPGPATTDIALPVLAYPGMIIEIDTYAMAEPD